MIIRQWGALSLGIVAFRVRYLDSASKDYYQPMFMLPVTSPSRRGLVAGLTFRDIPLNHGYKGTLQSKQEVFLEKPQETVRSNSKEWRCCDPEPVVQRERDDYRNEGYCLYRDKTAC